MSIDYLKALNPQQQEAVQHLKGPLMIIAGAGSGKTKVLTTRIVHLLYSGIQPFHILALTFTNKAAKEMKYRIETMLDNTDVRNLYIGTFHSIFARILRIEASHLGYNSNFTIYDTDDALSVLKSVIKDMGLDDKIYKPKNISFRISSLKNQLIGCQQYEKNRFLIAEDDLANRPEFFKIYTQYVDKCFRNNAMDFDDLLYLTYLLLTKNPAVLQKYQHKFEHILVDEYQDTNPAQYAIVKLLAAKNENICVVGDDAQSIYSFRGATIANILEFEKDYPDVKVIKLEQNYRSTQTILCAANEVIKNNKAQFPKNLWTNNPEGEQIDLVEHQNDLEEARFVAQRITQYKLRYHFRNDDFAILYRTNQQSRSFEESLRRRNIPYTIYGGTSFYQRKEVKDFLAYLRLVINPNDDEAIKRIINYPARGIGKTSLEKIFTKANELNQSIWHILENIPLVALKHSTSGTITQFVTMIQYFQSEIPKMNAYDLANTIGKHTHIVKELFMDKTPEGVARYENIQELLNSIKEFIETPINEEGEIIDRSLSEYLQQIALLTSADEDKENADSVKLMTIHAAKGLEFENVFIVGVEEGVFPNIIRILDKEDLEEERRLFYVSITRAKKNLFISFCNKRYRFGKLELSESSRFIQEIPKHWLKMQTLSPSFSIFNKSAIQEKAKTSGLFQKTTTPKIVEHTISSNFIAEKDTSKINIGDKIEHSRFGFGEVLRIEGSVHSPIALIKFEKNNEKKIMLNYAKWRLV
ncbi:MAG: ATP-dependent helicase [Chitinophagaceae bacterium]